MTLGDEDRFTLARAAALAGVEPSAWLSAAIRDKAADEEGRRKSLAELQPGPWAGWRTRDDRDTGWLTHYGPDGEEMFYMPGGWSPRPWWKGPSSRPWSVRTREAMLKDSAGRVRTFASQEAAKTALDGC